MAILRLLPGPDRRLSGRRAEVRGAAQSHPAISRSRLHPPGQEGRAGRPQDGAGICHRQGAAHPRRHRRLPAQRRHHAARRRCKPRRRWKRTASPPKWSASRASSRWTRPCWARCSRNSNGSPPWKSTACWAGWAAAWRNGSPRRAPRAGCSVSAPATNFYTTLAIRKRPAPTLA